MEAVLSIASRTRPTATGLGLRWFATPVAISTAQRLRLPFLSFRHQPCLAAHGLKPRSTISP